MATLKKKNRQRERFFEGYREALRVYEETGDSTLLDEWLIQPVNENELEYWLDAIKEKKKAEKKEKSKVRRFLSKLKNLFR